MANAIVSMSRPFPRGEAGENHGGDGGDRKAQALGRQRENADRSQDRKQRPQLNGRDADAHAPEPAPAEEQTESHQRESDDARHVARPHIGGVTDRQVARGDEGTRRHRHQKQAEQQILQVDPGTRHRTALSYP